MKLSLRVSIAFSILLFGSSCSDKSFLKAKAKEVETKKSSAEAASSLASDPVMVDGAYLMCFRDRNLDKNSTQTPTISHLGCALYADEDATSKANVNPDIVTAYDVQLVYEEGQEEASALERAPQSSRWHWTVAFKMPTVPQSLRMSMSVASQSPKEVSLSVHDQLPADLFVGSSAGPIGPFLMRDRKSQLCLSGETAWSYNAETKTSLSSPLSLVECSLAKGFQATRFGAGWHLHTPNPKPGDCSPQYGMVPGLCSQSCIDRADYGKKASLHLWGCTTSVEAQSVIVTTNTSYLTLALNGQWVTTAENSLIVGPEVNQALEWETISLVP
jgi:hypothetical protein